jgi:hypothetical protein
MQHVLQCHVAQNAAVAAACICITVHSRAAFMSTTKMTKCTKLGVTAVTLKAVIDR